MAILSTCNRTEIYCAGDEVHIPQTLSWLADAGQTQVDVLARHTYRFEGDASARHAFRVASGLDSMVLGESQILGQLKEAVRTASDSGALGTTLNQLFQRSFAVAKEVRSTTEIGAHSISMAAAAVRLAGRIFENIKETNILFVGAGEMIELCVAHFAAKSPKTITIANRSAERASARLSPKKINSFTGPAVFEPRVSSSFLSHLISSISGHNLARKVSFIKGDIGEILFQENINVIDDPLIKKGLGSRNFDSEGVDCKKLELIKKGKLNEIILDTYSSKMLNKKSNGRCGGTTNCYFENGSLFYSYGVVPASLLGTESLPNDLNKIDPYLTLITSMFMHGGFMHLIGNMLYMWIFADNIEDDLGKVKFILFYLASGVAAAMTQVYLNSGVANNPMMIWS